MIAVVGPTGSPVAFKWFHRKDEPAASRWLDNTLAQWLRYNPVQGTEPCSWLSDAAALGIRRRDGSRVYECERCERFPGEKPHIAHG